MLSSFLGMLIGCALTLLFHNNVAVKDSSIEGQWFLQAVMPSDTVTGKIPVLNFNLVKKTFSGNTGCNSIRGSFVLEGAKLKFDENIISTKMACVGYNENAFVKNLLRVNQYTIRKGVLILMVDGTGLSRWTRKPVKPGNVRLTKASLRPASSAMDILSL